MFVAVKYRLETYLDMNPDPEADVDVYDYHLAIQGEVYVYPPETGDDGVLAGNIEAYYVDIEGARAAGARTLDVFDAGGYWGEAWNSYFNFLYEHEGEDILALFLGDEEDLNLRRKPLYEEASRKNLLIIEDVFIEPQHQGRGLGLAAIWNTVRHFGRDCSLVLLKALPLVNQDSSPGEVAIATAKLERHFERLGFKTAESGASSVMYLDLDNERPSLVETLNSL